MEDTQDVEDNDYADDNYTDDNYNYLINTEYEPLPWKGNFQYPRLVRIRTPPDGNCFFHAIAKAYFIPYITGRLDGKPINRRQFIQDLRKDLAKELPSQYNKLSRGQLSDFSKEYPDYSLDNMVKTLNSTQPVDNVYNEFISNQLNKDIYVLDYIKRDVYVMGQDQEILYHNRPSIVLLYLPGHYELVGIKTEKGIQTLFSPEHPLIKSIKSRIKQTIDTSSEKDLKS